MTKSGKHNPILAAVPAAVPAAVLAALLAASLTTGTLAGPDDFVGPMPIRPEPASPAPVQPKAPATIPAAAPSVESPSSKPAPQAATQSAPQSVVPTAPEHVEPVKPLDLAPLADTVRASRPNPDAQIALGGKAKSETVAPATPAEATPAGGLGAARTILSLSAVVALILLIAGVVKKLSGRVGGLAAAIGAGGKAPSGILSILGRYPLDRSTTLILLRVDRRVLLLSQTRTRGRLGAGASSIATLSEFTSDADVASIVAKADAADGKSPSQRFQQALEDEAAFPEEQAPARTAPVKAAKKQTEQEALAAMLRAALEASKTERPATKPAAPAPAKAKSPTLGGSDAAAELRTRLAAMRAKAALGVRKTEMVA